ncbi:hypothetical protein K501DRAFT_167441 [Backusella circina FSU 941]|nr:hypothetical protein K501DRAFT_167441 [Backusella circina FSU 941]
MSITYESRTPCSDKSDAFSPPNEFINPSKQDVTPFISPSLHREFFNAIQSRRQEVSFATTPWVHPNYHPKEKTALLSISSENLNKMLLENNSPKIILVDVRSFSLYFQSRIKNAINLAVPSVLLKRPSYTLAKVCNSVTINMGERLRNWSEASSILFYDHNATNLIHSRNSATAILVGSKLREAGYKGHLYFLKGGFHAFHSEYPEQCDSSKINNSLERRRKCRKPSMELTLSTPLLEQTSKTAVNPFFSNIRQNMELCHGPLKERFAIRLPSGKISTTCKSQLSTWLHDVIEAEKGPKKLVEMYEQLERTEQQRLSLIMDFHSSNPEYDPSSMTFPFCITANMEKGTLNRYNNIWPYEYSRVKLKGSSRDDDYMNGNYIAFEDVDTTKLASLIVSNEQDNLVKKHLLSKHSLYTMNKMIKNKPNRCYIATQAPLPDTFNDFWKTIWNENSTVVVMLTREEEMNKIKCHRYWPTNLKETLKYGSINVTLLSEYNHPILNINGKRSTNDPDDESITVRTFNLATPTGQRQIMHFQYTGWTDFGVPDHPLGILQLIHLVNQQKTVASPIIVHCSAGCGRTGTFCVIDTVMQRLLSQNDNALSSDKIWETVNRFREQRISMVQTHRQFVFCYEAIVWWMLGYSRNDNPHMT